MTPQSDEDTVPRSGLVDALNPHRRVRSVGACDVGGASAQGRRRRRNEDAWGFRSGRVFVVADGMGGRPNGDVAANAAVESTLVSLSAAVHDWRQPVAAANEAVQAATTADGQSPAGAVLVALRCVDDRTSVLHIGDARAYRLRDGVAEPLTRDHSVAEAITDAGVRRADSGLRRRELAAVTSYLGDDDAWQEFTVRELTVRRGDRIVLCTDGVYRHVSPAGWRMAGDVDQAGDAAEFLVATARAAGATDDATALVVDLDDQMNDDATPGRDGDSDFVGYDWP